MSIAPPPTIFLRTSPTDMRKSFDDLTGLVRGTFGSDPTDGSLFLFVNKRRDRIKALWWDGDGYATMLPGGTFEPHAPTARPFVVSPGYQLKYLLAEDDSRLVAFIRNRGENVEIGGEPSSWVRKPTRTSFRLDVSLPGEYEGFLHAFDDETRETVRINGK